MIKYFLEKSLIYAIVGTGLRRSLTVQRVPRFAVLKYLYIQSFGYHMTEGNSAKGENVMSHSSIESLKIKAKLLQKAKKKSGTDFTLKESYALLAKNAGYGSWKEMKSDYELADLLNPPRWSALWKVWFSSKEEARLHLESNYLLPYRNQYFICDSNYLNALGLSTDDPDLLQVGHDWSSPKDKDAWARLRARIKHPK